MLLEEGVIKFRQEFKDGIFPEPEAIKELNFWRNLLHKAGLIGRNPGRYGGFGYGNVSQRLEPYESPRNRRKFAITGSQTGHLVRLDEKDYAVVHEYYPERNLVIVSGLVSASSESMTHGAIYDLEDLIRFVFHAHSPDIWKNSERLRIPVTREKIEYGTPEMAEEIKRLYMETNLKRARIFSMGGHEDGIFVFGERPEEAGFNLLSCHSRAKRLMASQ